MEKVWLFGVLQVSGDVLLTVVATLFVAILAPLIIQLGFSSHVKKDVIKHSEKSSAEHHTIENSINTITACLTEKEKLEKERHDSLTGDQQKIVACVNTLQSLPLEMSRLNNDNQMLQQQIDHQNQEIRTLVADNARLSEEIKGLLVRNTELSPENKSLTDRIARLSPNPSRSRRDTEIER